MTGGTVAPAIGAAMKRLPRHVRTDLWADWRAPQLHRMPM
jgi:hypothetical protein